MTDAIISTISQAYTDVPGACVYTSLSRRTIDQAKADGDLPYMKVGSKVVLAIADLDAWLLSKRIDVRADVARINGEG